MKTILISGKSGSGKDQFAKYLYDILDKNDFRVLVIHFADYVKYCAAQYYKWNGEKDVNGRTLLQHLGTDTVRKKYPEYWAEGVAKLISALENDWDYVLIPDCRFINEFKIVKNFNEDSVLVRINRLNKDGTYYLNPVLTPQQHSHISECELDDYDYDYIVDNSFDLEELKKRVKEFTMEIV